MAQFFSTYYFREAVVVGPRLRWVLVAKCSWQRLVASGPVRELAPASPILCARTARTGEPRAQLDTISDLLPLLRNPLRHYPAATGNITINILQ